MLYQLQPRRTRVEPSTGPLGFAAFSAGYGAYQSSHHSITFPCISQRPKGFGGYEPTRLVLRSHPPWAAPPYGLEPLRLAWSEEREVPFPTPKGCADGRPPRQAYSHSASVGKR